MAAAKWLVVLVCWLKDGVFRILPVVSLILYLILAIFSESRRREVKGFWRNCLWVAYELNDWAPAYVISNLYLETSPHDKIIVAFWVPFLLVHQARPDNISAYALEDSELWIRNMFLVLLESVGCMYIWYWYIFADCTTGILRYASGIMTFLGFLRYVESAWALRQCNLDIIGRSFEQEASSRIRGRLDKMQTLTGIDDEATVREKDDEALLVAHDLFEICKGAFCDYTVVRDRDAIRNMFSGKWESMCTVVEMELSLMYDILYTKAAVIHIWHGYTIRLASPLLTAAALLMFILYCKEGMAPRDKAISYTLLSTTFLFDVRWLLTALASAWTHSYIKHRSHDWLKHEFWCHERWKKLRGSVCLSRLSLWLWSYECGKEPKSYRRWAGTFGQENLLDKCTAGNRHTLYSILRQVIGLDSGDHSSGVEIPQDVKELVFSNIFGNLFPSPVGPTASEGLRPPSVDSKYDSDPSSPCESKKDTCMLNPEHPATGTNNRPPTQLHRTSCEEAVSPAVAWPEQLNYNAPARPYCHPEEQAAEDHWRYDHYETPPEAYEQDEYGMNGQNCCTYNEGTPDTQEEDDGQAKPDTSEQDDDSKSKSEQDKEFPPELQEVILIWHIAMDVFLLCNKGNMMTDKSRKHRKAIKRMSDYMVFLVAKRREMLPGLKLRSLYKNTQVALKKIRDIKAASEGRKCSSYVTNEKEELANWMQKNTDHLKDQDTDIIWEGTQLARVLLSLVPQDGQPESSVTDEEVASTVGKLNFWTPNLKKYRSMDDMLEFILDAWVRMLLYASIRCSRDSHAKQLSRGGELTTLVWIITEHAEMNIVKNHLPLLFSPREENLQ